jgi:molecular chaperone HscB
LETPLACGSCSTLFPCDDNLAPYAVFGLGAQYPADQRELRRRLLRFSRWTHPDFFVTAPPVARALAERNNAILNHAHAVLSDDVRHAEYWVRTLGGPNESSERAMPPEFLLEVLEWNETLEGARESKDIGALTALQKTLTDHRARALEHISKSLRDLSAPQAGDLREVRREINAIHYMDRALSEVDRRLAIDAHQG